jgi:hypothetical protein
LQSPAIQPLSRNGTPANGGCDGYRPDGALWGRDRRPVINVDFAKAQSYVAWLHENAADGFNVMFPFVPAGIDDFVNQEIPELQRRNLFRIEYEGQTLRENLGLARPANKFFAQPA